uniref:E3 ubiquitin-protein ligase TRIM71-like n=1 Tax=Crassostrea virginica TaxID=6565 RepID=A0A8B8BQV6_CRAVI|nr:E3 ubiquitin-protein ligase TRIM71-like [Crassostrea virginica]XP_022305301.1 E3 ubiquitin-protein ligase TRIM71-like [Crassostrea virginica]XP_022305302.1 E3 ubiquitin-protein ligase TRIM71-like [Crassostrea virginica]XP_022305303.1 E3 ubiquitin-protein ligase TRIM71-like [Crassostrea virginica]
MATSQGQDIIRCQLCPNPVEHHCNLCHVDLCFNCILAHMADKTKRHEIVDFMNRKEGPLLPECNSHDKTLCETFCNDCHEPTCILCVTTTHKKHDITDIKSIIENFKRCITADVEEMENTIRPKYKQTVGIGNSSKEFDRVMNAIQDQEDNICKVVREIGSRLKDEVAKQKREFEQKKNEVESTVAKEREELDSVMKMNKSILKSNDAKRILIYRSNNEQFRRGPKQMQISYPLFLSGKVNCNQLQVMFGSLQRSSNLETDRKHDMRKPMSNPVVVSTIQTPYGKETTLWRILCDEAGKIWISGDDRKVYQIDQSGSIQKTVSVSNDVLALSLSVDKELIFSVYWPATKVYRYDGNVVRTVVDLGQWYPRGLCHSANGDLLVSMRSVNETRSRVVRYSGTTETMVIQNDRQEKPLLSVGVSYVLLLTENGNGDICVADNAGNAVVVVNASGELRFKYQGNRSPKPNYKSFKPCKIATDVNQQILINDDQNDIVHVIDKDGNFLRYIEYPCNGGLSIDPDHNLIAGNLMSGEIRIIRYLQ